MVSSRCDASDCRGIRHGDNFFDDAQFVAAHTAHEVLTDGEALAPAEVIPTRFYLADLHRIFGAGKSDPEEEIVRVLVNLRDREGFDACHGLLLSVVAILIIL